MILSYKTLFPLQEVKPLKKPGKEVLRNLHGMERDTIPTSRRKVAQLASSVKHMNTLLISAACPRYRRSPSQVTSWLNPALKMTYTETTERHTAYSNGTTNAWISYSSTPKRKDILHPHSKTNLSSWLTNTKGKPDILISYTQEKEKKDQGITTTAGRIL